MYIGTRVFECQSVHGAYDLFQYCISTTKTTLFYVANSDGQFWHVLCNCHLGLRMRMRMCNRGLRMCKSTCACAQDDLRLRFRYFYKGLFCESVLIICIS